MKAIVDGGTIWKRRSRSTADAGGGEVPGWVVNVDLKGYVSGYLLRTYGHPSRSASISIEVGSDKATVSRLSRQNFS